MRMHRISFLLCTVLLLGVASQALALGPRTLQYEVKLKSLSFGDMGTRKMYIKGDFMRWEGKADRLPLLVIKNSQGTFLANPVQKVLGQYPEDSNRNNPRVYLPGPTESPKVFLAQVKAVKSGREKIGGQVCDVYSYLDPISGRKCRLWIGVKSSKPVKLVLGGEKKRSDTVVATYTKFVVGAKVPDSLFALPKGYTIRPMPRPKLTSSSPIPDNNPRAPI